MATNDAGQFLRKWWGVIGCAIAIPYLFWSAGSDKAEDIRAAYDQCRVTDKAELCSCYREGLAAELSVLDYFLLIERLRREEALRKARAVMGYCIAQ